VGVSFRAEVKTTIEGGADREYTKKGDSEDNTDSGPVALNGKGERESERTETKVERGEHTDIRYDAFLDFLHRTGKVESCKEELLVPEKE
jgi:hypothetical protein